MAKTKVHTPITVPTPTPVTNEERRVIQDVLESTAQPTSAAKINQYSVLRSQHPEKKGLGNITGDKLLGKKYEKANIFLVPLEDISINTQLFQNREKEYSQRTVDNIKDSVRKKEFHQEVMDPILLWVTTVKNKTVMYVLAGHSRLTAFKQLASEGATHATGDFKRIPARILEGRGKMGVSQETAMYLARISNNLATPETTLERVEYYQKLLKGKVGYKTVTAEIYKLEDKNAATIRSLVNLNPNGKTFGAYKGLSAGTGTNEAQIKNIASMIGKVREKFQELTNPHEDEIWDYLYTQKKYGTQASQINSVTELIEKVDRSIKKSGIESNPGRPLNVANLKELSDIEREYQKEKNAALAVLNAAETERKEKQIKYSLDLAVEKKKILNSKKEKGLPSRLSDSEEASLMQKYRSAMETVWSKIDDAARAYRDVLFRGPDVERLSKMEVALFL